MLALISIFWILLCVFLQVLLFNQLHLFGGVVFLFLIPLLKMPFQINRSVQIVLGFCCGLLVDIFTNTLGMHTLVCTSLMWLRLPLLHMFILADEVKTGTANIIKLGYSIFIRYMLMVIFIYTVMFYLVEAFTLLDIVAMLTKIITTTILTFAFIMSLELAINLSEN